MLRKSRTWGVLGLVFAGAALAGAGCGADDEEAAGSASTKVSVRMPFVANGGDAPFHYARKLGYYAEEGLDVEIRESGGSAQTVADVNRGGSDFGEVGGSNAMLSIAKGQELEILATVLGRNSFGFFVPKDAGITSVRQLNGKTIAAIPAMARELNAALTAGGVPREDVSPVFTDATALIPTYLSGKVDAMYTTALLAPAVQERKPTDVLLQSDLGYNPPDYVLIAKESTLRDRPAVVRGFVRATLRGWQAAKEDPEAAVDALLEEHPEVARPLALATLKATFAHYCSDAQAGEPYGRNAPRDFSTAARALKRFAGLTGSTEGDRFFTNELFEGSDAIAAGDC